MRRFTRLPAILVACALLGASPGVRAGEPWTAPIFAAPKTPKPPPAPAAALPDNVETAEQLYGKLEFDDANKVAERVVKQRGLTHDQLVRIYRVLATTHGFLDHEDPAREAFILLMTYEPEYQVDPNQGPKVTTPFFEARGFWRAQSGKPGIEVTSTLRAQEPGVLRVTTKDPTHIVKKVAVGYRFTTSGDFVTSQVTAGTSVQIDLPIPPPGKSRVEYYAQALDERDDVAFEAGNPQAPKSALVDAQAAVTPPPAGGGGKDGGDKGGGGVFASPVFWTIAAIVVVGGAAGAFFALRPRDAAAPTQASLAPSLQCGAAKCN
jgi:hypothetical protein